MCIQFFKDLFGMGKGSKNCPPVRKDFDVTKPNHDMKTFKGRYLYYLEQSNPLGILAGSSGLNIAKSVVDKAKSKDYMCLNEIDIILAKSIHDSAHHPVTGERLPLFGRKAAWVPVNTILATCMFAYYRSFPHAAIWHSLNQAFNATQFESNQDPKKKLDDDTIYKAYGAATLAAILASCGVIHFTKCYSPLVTKMGPFLAVVLAHCVSVPLLRNRELKDGVTIHDKDKKIVGKSLNAAKEEILQSILFRNALAAPVLLLTPMILNIKSIKQKLCRRPSKVFLYGLLTTLIVLTFVTPVVRAALDDEVPIAFSRIDEKYKEKYNKNPPEAFYYYRGE